MFLYLLGFLWAVLGFIFGATALLIFLIDHLGGHLGAIVWFAVLCIPVSAGAAWSMKEEVK